MKRPDDELDPQTMVSLEPLKQAPARDSGNAARGRALFLNQTHALRSGAPQTLIKKTTGWIPQQTGVLSRVKLFWQSLLLPLRNPIPRLAVLSVLLFVLFAGTGVTWVAAQVSLPDSFLYRVKLFSEDIRQSWASTPQSRFTLALKWSDRRVDELVLLTRQGRPIPVLLANRWSEQWQQAFEITAEMDPAGMQLALQLAQAHQRQQSDRLQLVGSDDPVMEWILIQQQGQAALIQTGLHSPDIFIDEVQRDYLVQPLGPSQPEAGDPPVHPTGLQNPDSAGKGRTGTPSVPASTMSPPEEYRGPGPADRTGSPQRTATPRMPAQSGDGLESAATKVPPSDTLTPGQHGTDPFPAMSPEHTKGAGVPQSGAATSQSVPGSAPTSTNNGNKP